MKRSDLTLWLAIVSCIVFGAVGTWEGLVGTTTFCSPACSTSHSATIQPLPLVVGLIFLAVGLYLLVRTVRMLAQPPAASGVVDGGNDRVELARHVREFYLDPKNQLCDPVSPSEFDRMMLDLFAAVEAGSADIDARIDGIRTLTRQQGWWRSARDRMKARKAWECGAMHLQWGPSRQNRQLRRNWNRVLRIPGLLLGADVTIPARWVEPVEAQTAGLANEESVGLTNP